MNASWRYIVFLSLIAITIRLGAVLWLRDIHEGPVGIDSADEVQFEKLAKSLSEGRGFELRPGRPTAFRAPGYPMVLAGLYLTLGSAPPIVYGFHILLGAASCVLTYLIGRQLLSEREARIAGILSAIYLGHVYFATLYLSENLFVPLLGLGVWLLIRYLQGGGIGLVFSAGLILGFSTLTRPFTILMLVLVPLALCFGLRNTGRRWMLAGAVFCVSMLAVVMPWTYRNFLVFERFVLVASNGGSTFYGGNNGRVVSETKYYGYWLSTVDLPGRDLIDAQPDEVSHDKMEWKLGVDWLKENPSQIPKLLALKFLRMWWLSEFDAGHRMIRMLAHFPFLMLWGLSLIRLVRDRSLWSASWLLIHASMLATITTCLIFWGSTRFRDANAPFLALYAVLGLHPWRRTEK